MEDYLLRLGYLTTFAIQVKGVSGKNLKPGCHMNLTRAIHFLGGWLGRRSIWLGIIRGSLCRRYITA